MIERMIAIQPKIIAKIPKQGIIEKNKLKIPNTIPIIDRILEFDLFGWLSI